MEVMVYGLMNEALWRERQRDLLRKGSKVRWDMERRSGLWARAWGWLRRGVTMLGYSDPESSRGAREAVGRSRGCGAGGSGDSGGMAWTARRRSPGSRRP